MATLKFNTEKLQICNVLKDQSLNQAFVENFFVCCSNEEVTYAIFIVTINQDSAALYADVQENYNIGVLTYNEYINQVVDSVLSTSKQYDIKTLLECFKCLCNNDYNKMCSVIGTVELMIKISKNYYTTNRLINSLDKSEVETIKQIEASEKIFEQCFNSLEKLLILK